MNLRISLIFVIILSLLSIGVSWVVENPPGGKKTPDLPYFYTVSPDDIRKIDLSSPSGHEGFVLANLQQNIWYFANLQDMPVNLNRFGGMSFLLGGPKIKRVLSKDATNLAQYGLDHPSLTVTLTLRDNSQVSIELGNATPDGQSNYAMAVGGGNELVLVDSSWGNVIGKLISDPPYPTWHYTLPESEANEILFYRNNNVVRGISFRPSTGWVECTLPLGNAVPCTGTSTLATTTVESFLHLMANPPWKGVVQVARSQSDVNPAQYGTTVDAPYLDIRLPSASTSSPNVINVNHVSMILGNKTDNGSSMYVQAMEQPSVEKVDAAWGEKVLQMFNGPYATSTSATTTSAASTPTTNATSSAAAG